MSVIHETGKGRSGTFVCSHVTGIASGGFPMAPGECHAENVPDSGVAQTLADPANASSGVSGSIAA